MTKALYADHVRVEAEKGRTDCIVGFLLNSYAIYGNEEHIVAVIALTPAAAEQLVKGLQEYLRKIGASTK